MEARLHSLERNVEKKWEEKDCNLIGSWLK